MQKRKLIIFWLLFDLCNILLAQTNTSNMQGIQIITSGGKAADSLFIALLGGPEANVVFIPTAASSLKSDSGVIWNPDEETNKNEFSEELKKRFHLNNITVLHTRSWREANTESFVQPLREAKAVWISGGNAGRFMAVYKGTVLAKELKLFLQRGGILAGESGGAIVQGSYTIRGDPNKPVLMVKGSEKGLGLIQNVAINPHLSGQKRENELVTIIDKYPKLLGIGIDDDTGFLIKNGIGEVFGHGRIAIYDNQKHGGGWYYWLKPGDQFDFNNRTSNREKIK
jgi:cyanophycinase